MHLRPCHLLLPGRYEIVAWEYSLLSVVVVVALRRLVPWPTHIVVVVDRAVVVVAAAAIFAFDDSFLAVVVHGIPACEEKAPLTVVSQWNSVPLLDETLPWEARIREVAGQIQEALETWETLAWLAEVAFLLPRECCLSCWREEDAVTLP